MPPTCLGKLGWRSLEAHLVSGVLAFADIFPTGTFPKVIAEAWSASNDRGPNCFCAKLRGCAHRRRTKSGVSCGCQARLGTKFLVNMHSVAESRHLVGTRCCLTLLSRIKVGTRNKVLLFASQSRSLGLLSVGDILAQRCFAVSTDSSLALALFETLVLNGPSCHLRSRVTFNSLVFIAISIITLSIFLLGVSVSASRNVMTSLHLQGLVHSDLLQLLSESLRNFERFLIERKRNMLGGLGGLKMHVSHMPGEALTTGTLAHLAILRVVVPDWRSLSVTFSFHHHLSGLSGHFISETELLGGHGNIAILCSYRDADTTVNLGLNLRFDFLSRLIFFLLQDFSHDLINFIDTSLFRSFLTPTGLTALAIKSGSFSVGTRHLSLL